MGRFGAAQAHPFDGGAVTLRACDAAAIVALARMNEVSVLGAANVFDQQQMTRARALKKQGQKRYNDASLPNH